MNKQVYNIAILGAGNIANAMAKTVTGMMAQGRPVCLYAVAARELERAQAFAQKWSIPQAYGSYSEMLADPAVDLVYVATPHSHHAEHVSQCVEAGKAVLCEKPFTGNARQAREVLEAAEKKQILVTEGIWTRYMPSRRMISDIIESGEIGDVVTISANLGYAMEHVQRIKDPALAGGALLDVGVYVLNFASMVLGDEVVRMESSVEMLPTGVDRSENISLYYKGGQSATLQSSAAVNSSRRGVIYGTNGAIVIDNVNNIQTIDVYPNLQNSGEHRRIHVPEQITGFEYEVEACIRALQAGECECPEMPHSETICMMSMMDDLRAQWHMVYPFD